MNKIKIAIDMDEVVVDLFTEMFEKEGLDINKQTEWDLSGETLKLFQDKYVTYKYYLSRPPVVGAVYGIRELAGIGFEIVFVTATPYAKKNQNILEAKKAWLRKHFEDIEYSFVSTSDKHLIAADIIIDDKQATCTKWNSLGKPAIVFARPWNSKQEVGEEQLKAPFYRTSWDGSEGPMTGGMISCVTNAVLWMEMVGAYKEEKLRFESSSHTVEPTTEKKVVKTRIDLLPAWGLDAMGVVMGYGRELGYLPLSWLISGKHDAEKHLACAHRHINHEMRGDDINHADGGSHHVIHAAVRLLMYYERKMYEEGIHPQQGYLEELALDMKTKLEMEEKRTI